MAKPERCSKCGSALPAKVGKTLCGARVRIVVTLDTKQECPDCMEIANMKILWGDCLPMLAWTKGSRQHYSRSSRDA